MSTSNETAGVLDLLYCDDRADYEAAQQTIRTHYPDAKFEDGSDFIHHDRFQVEVPVGREEWWEFVLCNDLAHASFHLQMAVMTGTEGLREVLDRVKANRKEDTHADE